MRKLIKKVYYYSDGTYTEENFNNIETDVSKNFNRVTEILNNQAISRKTAYNLAVYILCTELYKNDKTDFLNDAVNTVAREVNVSNSSVLDKLYRQLNLKSYEYKKILIKALDVDTAEFKWLLIQNVGKNSKADDEAIIKDIL